MEATALNHAGVAGLRGPTPLLRLQSDERLIVLVRRGNHAAFEALVARYQARLLAFCRHMLSSREDAEDVLQEVFAAAFNAMLADERPINVRPWLYRIARNRSLNHLRRTQPIGVDSMDVHFAEGGTTTADKVHKREEFRLLVADVQELPETQKTALLLREIDALSYEQIAEAMETTIPSVKSLLVRARVSLAEAAEARQLTCHQVREELGEVAEGLRRTSAPVRRHLRTCERCQGFRAQLKTANRALAAVFPVAPLLLFKKLLLAQFGMTASAGAGTAAGAAAGGAAAGGASAMGAGLSTLATKTAATLAAAAIVTTGAVEVQHLQSTTRQAPAVLSAAAPAPEPEVIVSAAQPVAAAPVPEPVATPAAPAEPSEPADDEAEPSATPPAVTPATSRTAEPATVPPAPGTAAPAATGMAALAPVQSESESVSLAPSSPVSPHTGGGAPAPPTTQPAAQEPAPEPAPEEAPPPVEEPQPAPAEPAPADPPPPGS